MTGKSWETSGLVCVKCGASNAKTPQLWRGLRIFRTDLLKNPRARNRDHRRRDGGNSIDPWGVGVGAVHDQISDCYGSGNFAPWCKFATFSVSPDETAITL